MRIYKPVDSEGALPEQAGSEHVGSVQQRPQVPESSSLETSLDCPRQSLWAAMPDGRLLQRGPSGRVLDPIIVYQVQPADRGSALNCASSGLRC